MTITLTQATLTDFPTVEKMVPFYIYDVSRYCGWPFEGKEEGENIGYHHQRLLDNVRRCFNEAGRYPFLIKVDGELAGFILIKSGCWSPNIDWYLGEFFILARFQGKGIAEHVISQLWDRHPGTWQLEVIPKNTRALHFWRRAIHAYSHGKFKEILDFVDYTPDPKVIFRFDTQQKNPEPVIHIHHAMALDIPHGGPLP